MKSYVKCVWGGVDLIQEMMQATPEEKRIQLVKFYHASTGT